MKTKEKEETKNTTGNQQEEYKEEEREAFKERERENYDDKQMRKRCEPGK